MDTSPIIERLAGIQAALMASHAAGSSTSNASKGRDREDFIHTLLQAVMPQVFRFGHGDIIDLRGKATGQLDLVVEYPFLPSLPISERSSRLYLAEGVAAVIEVKSHISTQWEEVQNTVSKVASLRRSFGASLSYGSITQDIPCFAVGYKGWKSLETVQEHLLEAGLDGILVIDGGFYASSRRFKSIFADGPAALWGLVCGIHDAATALIRTNVHPAKYAQSEVESSSAPSPNDFPILDLGHPGMGDDAVQHLKSPNDVKILSLSHSAVTDKGLAAR